MKIIYTLKEKYTEDTNFVDTKFTNKKCQYPINMKKMCKFICKQVTITAYRSKNKLPILHIKW